MVLEVSLNLDRAKEFAQDVALKAHDKVYVTKRKDCGLNPIYYIKTNVTDTEEIIETYTSL